MTALATISSNGCWAISSPVEAGHDRFGYDLVQRVLGDFIEVAVLKSIAGEHHLNMTQLALNLSEYVNGVAKRHAETSAHMFPGYRVRAVTNGVHAPTWTSPSMQRLFDTHLPGWRHEPEILVRADCCIPDEHMWEAHLEAKQALIRYVRSAVGTELDPRLPIVGFARRMTAYKRPDLLFSDLGRLRAIARTRPFQIVLAGKAHPADDGGKRSIEAIHRYRHELADVLPVVFLANYDMAIAAVLVSGSDLWVNTPLPPYEASGTSGMKAAMFYDDRAAWIRVMKGAIAKNGSIFTSHRMVRRYAADAYMR